jgi:NTE family protein
MQLIHLYRSSGLPLADIKTISFDETNGEMQIIIREKIISEINIIGNDKTNDPVIEREFPIELNDYLTIEKLETGLANLRATELFESVDIQVVEQGDSTALNIIVVEKISSLIRFGLRIDNVDLTQVSLDLRDENFLGTGTELGTILFYGDRKKSFTLEHRANRLFDTYLTYKIKTYFNLDDVNVYDNVTPVNPNKIRRDKTSEYRQLYLGASLGIGSQFQKFGNIFIEAKYERNEVKNKIDFPEERTYKKDIASVKFSLSIDSQNKYPYPTFGSRLSTYYETGLSVLNAETGFTKFYFDYRGYLSIGSSHTLAPEILLGFADETLPLSQQFSLGGQNNFFGLREDEYRGRQIFATSLEYQFVLPVKLFFDAYFRIRYDLGSIWSQKEQIRFKDLKHGIGTTLSLDTPIGPADFSVGRSFIIERTLLDSKIIWGQLFFYFSIGYYY